jgi:hypothetical protein
MSKYIIKNCEQIHSADNFCWSKNVRCQDCTDCVMKQIVKKCRKSLEVSYCPIEQEILELLNIQEAE